MSEQFKFKLAVLLNLRKFNEKKIKIEIGRIISKITAINEKMKIIKNDIETGYKSQKNVLKESTSGLMLKFYPLYFDGKRADLKECENHLEDLQKQYNEKRLELQKAMGETKLLEKMEFKKRTEHKKNVEKKEQDNIEELFRNKRTVL